jgi:hypothetical protein
VPPQERGFVQSGAERPKVQFAPPLLLSVPCSFDVAVQVLALPPLTFNVRVPPRS